MDFFQHRYYRLNKTFMTLCGYWPYQSTRASCGRRTVLVFILISQIAPQILAVVKYRDDRATVIDCIITFLFEAICATKGITCVWNVQKIKKLLIRIRTDWQVWGQDQEVNILHKYAEQGRKMSLAITAMIYSAASVYVAQPIIPKVIDALLKNGTAHGQFPTPIDYYHLDLQKYYFYIAMYIYICLCMGLIPVMASEITLIITVQHVCAIYAALGCKLQRIMNNTPVQSKGRSYAMDKKDMADLVWCIDIHNAAIDCGNLIEATYTWTLFYLVGLGTIILNLSALRILLGKQNPVATLGSIGVAIASILHLYADCYISQMLLDHSISIHSYIYDSQWYKLAPKAQNLLQLMIMRCSVPCKITAGHFFMLSMRTFGQVIRTAMSYFAVLRTIQI